VVGAAADVGDRPLALRFVLQDRVLFEHPPTVVTELGQGALTAPKSIA
jgi:hypothetical protein